MRIVRPVPADWFPFWGLTRAHAEIIRDLDRDLEARHGVSMTEADILLVLYVYPPASLTMSEIADLSLNTQGGASRIVTRLVQAGLVSRERGDKDTRQILPVLTDLGHRTAREIGPAFAKMVQARFYDRLDPEDIAHLAAVWRKLVDSPYEQVDTLPHFFPIEPRS